MKHLLLVPMVLATLSTTLTPSRMAGHEARVEGAVSTSLSGSAHFGPVRQGRQAPASFSLELGAYSERGAVIFSRVSGERPEVGTYEITPLSAGAEAANAFHALVSLGSAEQPLGAFRAMSGRVTISYSSENRVIGEYELKAVGFLAADLDAEDREITVRGGFTAEPSVPASVFEGEIAGAIRTMARGAAEFGAVGSGADRSFSLTLGAESETGAIILARSSGTRPAVGVYQVGDAAERHGDFRGQIVTGSTGRPSGVFRVEQGTLTITASSNERVEGTFALHGTGFLATEPDREDREVTVTGSFSATSSGTQLNYTLR